MDESLPSTLSPQAALLHRILRDYTRGKHYCWPGQKRLAVLLGRSVRSVRVYLRELRDAGLVVVRRQGLSRTNHYYLAAAAGQERQPAAGQERQPAAGQERQPAAGQERQPTCGSNLNYPEEDSSSTEPAAPAAAVSCAPLDSSKAQNALEAVGAPPSWARQWAAQDADFALVAAAHFQERFADAQKKPVQDRMAYMRGAFNDPTAYGFQRTSTGWQKLPSRQSVDAARQTRRKRQASEAAEWAERRRREREADLEVRTDQQAWADLSDAERCDILATVRRNCPLQVRGKADEYWVVVSLCFREMKARRKEAKP